MLSGHRLKQRHLPDMLFIKQKRGKHPNSAYLYQFIYIWTFESGFHVNHGLLFLSLKHAIHRALFKAVLFFCAVIFHHVCRIFILAIDYVCEKIDSKLYSYL